MRIGDITNLLGSGRDGSIYTTDCGLCRSPRRCRWGGIVPDVQSRDSPQALPKYLSSDHDPLYRFHQWQANLRVLAVQEIKTVPYVPLSHPFLERLIGTIRREPGILRPNIILDSSRFGEQTPALSRLFQSKRVHS